MGEIELRAALDELAAADRQRRSADAREVNALIFLAENYSIGADPALAAEQADKARADRYVTVGRYDDATMMASARLDVLDGMCLDASVDRIADILLSQGNPETKKVLRATALGILATPARALQMMQQAIQPALDDPLNESDDWPAGASQNCPMTATAPQEGNMALRLAPGHELCGRITTDPERLLPRATIVLHLAADPSGELSPVGRLEQAGAVPIAKLNELLADVRVTVRPVVDLNETPSVDRHEIPESIRQAVLSRYPYDAFPFSNRSARHLDLDHTIPYLEGGPPGQTRWRNLTPLHRRAHRAKTCGAWLVHRDDDGDLIWTSPLGYRYAITPWGTTPLPGPGIPLRAGPAA